MATTVATLFDDMRDAQAAFNDLIANGCKPDQLSVAALVEAQAVATEFRPGGGASASDTGIAVPHHVDAKGIGRLFVTGRLTRHIEHARASLLGALVDADIAENDARPLAEGVRRGNVLFVAEAQDDTQAERCARVMATHHPIVRERRIQAWRASGWRDFDESARPPGTDELAHERSLTAHRLEYHAGASVPRNGAGGGVWTGRAPYARDERAIADHARAERLESQQVQGYGPEKAPPHPVADNPPAYRQHFDATYADMSFDEFLPAYRYGALLANSAAFEDHDWDALEPQAQRDWERVHPRTWDRYRQAIHFGWEQGRQQNYEGAAAQPRPQPGRRQ